jgi:hypothetical protein
MWFDANYLYLRGIWVFVPPFLAAFADIARTLYSH